MRLAVCGSLHSCTRAWACCDIASQQPSPQTTDYHPGAQCCYNLELPCRSDGEWLKLGPALYLRPGRSCLPPLLRFDLASQSSWQALPEPKPSGRTERGSPIRTRSFSCLCSPHPSIPGKPQVLCLDLEVSELLDWRCFHQAMGPPGRDDQEEIPMSR